VPFIKVVERAVEAQQNLYLYLSNRCGLYTLVLPVVSPMFPFGATWTLADVDEDEPRDLAFAGEGPVLLGTTAGLHNQPLGLSPWRLVGGGRDGGYNASCRSTRSRDRSTASASISTSARATTASRPGAPRRSTSSPSRRKGTSSRLERHVQPGDCNVTFEVGERTFKSAEGLANVGPFTDAMNRREAPVRLRTGHFAQAVKKFPTTFGRGMVQSENCAQPQKPFAYFTEVPVGLARLGHAGDENNLTVLYQPYRDAGDALKLLRLERFYTSTEAADTRYPLITGFGSLGINPHMSDMYPVYGVDPVTSTHVIAPSVGSDGKMMFTENGGGCGRTSTI
jgi:hypothetical protein